MGIASLFQGSSAASSPDGEGPAEAPDHRQATFIGSTVRLVGALRSNHDVMVQGRVEGPMLVTGEVLVDGGGQVEGEIRANMIRVRGRTRGALLATQQISLEAGSEHRGAIHAPALLVEAGAVMDGEVKVGRGLPGAEGSPTTALGDEAPLLTRV